MNCVKCGKPIPDGELFCPNCSTTPLRTGARQTGSRARREKPRAGKNASAGLIAAVVVLSLIAAAALFGMLWTFHSLSVQRASLRAREAEVAAREADADAQADSYAIIEESLNEANQQNQALEASVAELEKTIKDRERSDSQNQYDLDQAKKQLEALQESSAQTEEALTALTEEYEALVQEHEDLSKEHQELEVSTATMTAKMDWIDAYVVYVENDGTEYYHSYECSKFKKQSFWVYNRKLAENKGYTACPICGG